MAKGRKNTAKRDEKIKAAIKDALGMSVPKYISIMYGRSQKAAQIMFNQPDRRKPNDEALLVEIAKDTKDAGVLSAKFIQHILGSDPVILNNIQTTIDSRFLSKEAGNTVKSLTRPILSKQPDMQQLQMVIDKYYFPAVDMQKQWMAAREDKKKAKGAVRIPYTVEQIKSAFMVVIDMCRMIIELKSGDMAPVSKEVRARAHALMASAAIQIGRYDLVEENIALWRDSFEFHKDKDVPLRIRNLLIQKELIVLKRKGEADKGLKIADTQWNRCDKAKWIEVEPLVLTGLELAIQKYETAKSSGADDSALAAEIDQIQTWLSRIEAAPDRAEEIGGYLQKDPELAPLRSLKRRKPINDIWSGLMRKFGFSAFLIMGIILLNICFGPLGTLVHGEFDLAVLDYSVFHSYTPSQHEGGQNLIITAGANPGQLIWDIIERLLDAFL